VSGEALTSFCSLADLDKPQMKNHLRFFSEAAENFLRASQNPF
jgi:hypothetical protein